MTTNEEIISRTRMFEANIKAMRSDLVSIKREQGITCHNMRNRSNQAEDTRKQRKSQEDYAAALFGLKHR